LNGHSGGIYDAKTSSLRSLAAGSALLFLFAPTLYAAEQAAPEAPPVDARAWI
jgi:D-alanyl-D-alanine carboxypeptidase (penicillin-binding protein 5/6)